MKKMYVVRPALYFIKKYVQEHSRDIQGFVLMMAIWMMGLITGFCGAYMFLNIF